MNSYVYERLAAMHRHELQQAAEHERLASHLAHHCGSLLHRTAGRAGLFLMKTGMKLKQFELRADIQSA